LIHSRTELALAAANEQLAGKLSQRINQLRDAHSEVMDEVKSTPLKAVGPVDALAALRQGRKELVGSFNDDDLSNLFLDAAFPISTRSRRRQARRLLMPFG
jgi:hypothetical protein